MKRLLLLSAFATCGLLLFTPSRASAQNPTATPANPTVAPIPGTEGSTNAAPGSTPVGDVTRLRRLVRDVATNTDNIRFSGTFGAQLWLTADGDFFEDWRKPQAPTINPVQIVQRGQPIYTVIIFYGEATTASGLDNVSYDITVLRPDGTIYNRRDALVGFQNLAPTDGRELQLGRNYLNISVGPDDPAGLYTVSVIVHDNVSKVDLPLKQTFVVQ